MLLCRPIYKILSLTDSQLKLFC